MRVITLAAWLCLMSAHAIAIRIPLPDILKDLVEEADTRQQSSTATLSVISSTAFLVSLVENIKQIMTNKRGPQSENFLEMGVSETETMIEGVKVEIETLETRKFTIDRIQSKVYSVIESYATTGLKSSSSSLLTTVYLEHKAKAIHAQ